MNAGKWPPYNNESSFFLHFERATACPFSGPRGKGNMYFFNTLLLSLVTLFSSTVCVNICQTRNVFVWRTWFDMETVLFSSIWAEMERIYIPDPRHAEMNIPKMDWCLHLSWDLLLAWHFQLTIWEGSWVIAIIILMLYLHLLGIKSKMQRWVPRIYKSDCT